MGTYAIDVASIMAEAGASVEIDDEVPLDSLTIGDTVAVFEAPPHLHATISNTGEDLVLLGSVDAIARLECSRCLESFSSEISGSLEGMLTPQDQRDALAEDEEWYPLTPEGTVDLLPAIRAALALEIPFAPLHDPECRGICPTCGCDLNRDTCSCVREDVDAESPFSVLRDLVGTDEEP